MLIYVLIVVANARLNFKPFDIFIFQLKLSLEHQFRKQEEIFKNDFERLNLNILKLPKKFLYNLDILLKLQKKIKEYTL